MPVCVGVYGSGVLTLRKHGCPSPVPFLLPRARLPVPVPQWGPMSFVMCGLVSVFCPPTVDYTDFDIRVLLCDCEPLPEFCHRGPPAQIRRENRKHDFLFEPWTIDN